MILFYITLLYYYKYGKYIHESRISRNMHFIISKTRKLYEILGEKKKPEMALQSLGEEEVGEN